MTSGLEFRELLDYTEAENLRWREWLEQHPEALAVGTDIAGEQNVAGLLVHIFAVELRYAERLLNLPVTEYEKLRSGNLGQVFAIGEDARAKLKLFLSSATAEQMKERLTFPTRTAGELSASKRKIFGHALLHGVRHWAQIATVLRRAGYGQDWPHDLIFTDALE